MNAGVAWESNSTFAVLRVRSTSSAPCGRFREVAAVILDLTMPRMDGAEAFREMRQIRPESRTLSKRSLPDIS